MQDGPSRTALRTATFRAAHQVVDFGSIFPDAFAVRMLGVSSEELARDAAAAPELRQIRLTVAARARVAEGAVAAAVTAGTAQLVLLGAGLDTYAWRSPRAGLRIFEVDHPSTQRWKRARVADAGLAWPQSLTLVPMDFERQTLAEGLSAAGFDADRPTCFAWLGVIPYLTREAVLGTFGYIASLPGGAQIVFDFLAPSQSLKPQQRAVQQWRASTVAAVDEPFITFFLPEEIAGELRRLGFSDMEELPLADLVEHSLGIATGTLATSGYHLARVARTRAQTPAAEV